MSDNSNLPVSTSTPQSADNGARLAQRFERVLTLAPWLAIVTLSVLVWQSWVGHQALLETQRQLQLSREQFERTRRTDLIAHLYERNEDGTPKSNARTRGEALLEFVALERSLGTRPNLKGAIVSGVDLSKVDLSDTSFIDADLRQVELPDAKLTDANFSGADLSGANLFGADLTRADLTRADLSGADLFDAVLIGALLLRTNLRDANLGVADFIDAVIIDSDFRDADLLSTRLVGVAGLDCQQLMTAKSWEFAITDLECPIPESPPHTPNKRVR